MEGSKMNNICITRKVVLSIVGVVTLSASHLSFGMFWYGRHEIRTAAENNDQAMIKKFFDQCESEEEKNKFINQVDQYEHDTLLHIARDPEMVKFLLENGANPNILVGDKEKWTTLSSASFQADDNSKEKCKLLLEFGANIDQHSLEGVKRQINQYSGQFWSNNKEIYENRLAMLELTQKFDEWVKTSQSFHLTDKEESKEELRNFRDSLFKSKRAKIVKEIVKKTKPTTILSTKDAPTRDKEKERKFADTTIYFES